MSELPEGWHNVLLGDLCEVKGGKRLPKGDEFATVVTPHPYIRVSDFDNRSVSFENLQYLSEGTYRQISNYTISSKDVYISIAGTIGLVGTIPAELEGANLTENAAKITNIAGLDQRFLVYYLSSDAAQQHFDEQTVSTSQPKLALFRIKTLPVSMPPLAEQKRIADKLDALLARVDRARARLDRVPLILKRFRQAVLAAATSGQLTEDWREGNSNISTEFSGASSITTNKRLFDLPPNWQWVSLESICEHIVDCPHSTPKWADSGYICVRTTNFKPGYLDLSEVRYVTEETYQQRIERLKPKPGDVLYSREGGILGIACMIPLEIELCLGQRMMLMRTVKSYLPTLLMSWLNSPEILKLVRGLTSGSASPHLNVKEIRNFPTPFPPLPEQHEIVRRVETLFAFADRLQARYQSARRQVEQLTPSLLAKAFRGELVPQDLNDEPAAVLLERLRGEKSKPHPNPPRGRGLSRGKV